jgi:release factor glutamine methyltransferase
MACTLHERIAVARRTLIAAGFSPGDAAIDAEVLAREVLGWDRATLLTRGREPAAPTFIAEFDAAVRRRAAREPVAFITGHREFWGLDLEVTRDVLIPRPESELVVQAALEQLAGHGAVRILDIGTGSGCLAIALATELPGARVVATDVSHRALDVARRNARRHGIAARVQFVCAHLLDAVRGPFDLVVSNPPYVPAGAELPVDVAAYEPATALYAGDDGLAVLRELLAAAPAHLSDRGSLIVEFGFGQAESVRELARNAAWRKVSIRNDLQGIPRVAVLTCEEIAS